VRACVREMWVCRACRTSKKKTHRHVPRSPLYFGVADAFWTWRRTLAVSRGSVAICGWRCANEGKTLLDN